MLTRSITTVHSFDGNVLIMFIGSREGALMAEADRGRAEKGKYLPESNGNSSMKIKMKQRYQKATSLPERAARSNHSSRSKP